MSVCSGTERSRVISSTSLAALGGSFLAKHHLDFIPRVKEGQWLAAHAKPHAMMDLSDGLAKDLPRMAAASGVEFVVDESSLPCSKGCSPEQAWGDGEDV